MATKQRAKRTVRKAAKRGAAKKRARARTETRRQTATRSSGAGPVTRPGTSLTTKGKGAPTVVPVVYAKTQSKRIRFRLADDPTAWSPSYANRGAARRAATRRFGRVRAVPAPQAAIEAIAEIEA